jgi:hypothetical protein
VTLIVARRAASAAASLPRASPTADVGGFARLWTAPGEHRHASALCRHRRLRRTAGGAPVVNATGDGQQRVDRRVEWGQRVECADDAPSGAAIAGVVDHRLDGIASAANVSGQGPSSIPRWASASRTARSSRSTSLRTPRGSSSSLSPERSLAVGRTGEVTRSRRSSGTGARPDGAPDAVPYADRLARHRRCTGPSSEQGLLVLPR